MNELSLMQAAAEMLPDSLFESPALKRILDAKTDAQTRMAIREMAVETGMDFSALLSNVGAFMTDAAADAMATTGNHPDLTFNAAMTPKLRALWMIFAKCQRARRE